MAASAFFLAILICSLGCCYPLKVIEHKISTDYLESQRKTVYKRDTDFEQNGHPSKELCAFLVRKKDIAFNSTELIVFDGNTTSNFDINWFGRSSRPYPIFGISDKIDVLVYTNCTLITCTSKSFEGECSRARGTESFLSAFELDRFESMNCFCNLGNLTSVPKKPELPDTPGLCPNKLISDQRSSCAVTYSGSYCHGERSVAADGLTMPVLGYTTDLFRKPDPLSSVEVNPGCSLIMCEEAGFKGACKHLDGEKSGMNFNAGQFEMTFKSKACRCNAGHPEEDIQALRNQYRNFKPETGSGSTYRHSSYFFIIIPIGLIGACIGWCFRKNKQEQNAQAEVSYVIGGGAKAT